MIIASKINCINSTQGGVHIKDTTELDFKSSCQLYFKDDKLTFKLPIKRYIKYIKRDFKKDIRIFKKELKSFHTFNKCLKNLARPKANKSAKIKAIDHFKLRFICTYSLFLNLISPVIYQSKCKLAKYLYNHIEGDSISKENTMVEQSLYELRPYLYLYRSMVKKGLKHLYKHEARLLKKRGFSYHKRYKR